CARPHPGSAPTSGDRRPRAAVRAPGRPARRCLLPRRARRRAAALLVLLGGGRPLPAADRGSDRDRAHGPARSRRGRDGPGVGGALRGVRPLAPGHVAVLARSALAPLAHDDAPRGGRILMAVLLYLAGAIALLLCLQSALLLAYGEPLSWTFGV